tara:strand:- start:1250 stop:1585 length:336 start_codon:yes stop_codon:yes gene_type:complete
MAFWALTTYTRPDTSTEFYIRKSVLELKGNTAIGEKIVELENAGKITHYSISESADNLKQYIKIGFDSEATYNTLKSFVDGDAEGSTEKATWLSSTGITAETTTSTSEPSV